MKRFEPPEEPAKFRERAVVRGHDWLARNPDGRPADYWSEFRRELGEGFGRLCAYSVLFTPQGTVDHFVSVDEDRSQAYDWGNLRYAAQWLNSSKQDLESSQLIDPFEVENDWFEIILPSLQLVPTSEVPDDELAKVEFIIERLHLRDDERVLSQRREWYRMYQDNELTLEE